MKNLTNLTNMINMTMVRYYRSSCIDLPVALVGCQVEGRPSRLNQFCQGEYVIFYDIDFEVGERDICRNCVDNIGGGGGQVR